MSEHRLTCPQTGTSVWVFQSRGGRNLFTVGSIPHLSKSGNRNLIFLRNHKCLFSYVIRVIYSKQEHPVLHVRNNKVTDLIHSKHHWLISRFPGAALCFWREVRFIFASELFKLQDECFNGLEYSNLLVWREFIYSKLEQIFELCQCKTIPSCSDLMCVDHPSVNN